MKFSSFILSVGGFWIVYICYADWIDDWYERFVEKYFGYETEEVPPFVSSMTSGTTEFDNLVLKLAQAKKKATISIYTTACVLFSSVGVLMLYRYSFLQKTGKTFFRRGKDLAVRCYKSVCHIEQEEKQTLPNKEEIQSLVTEFLEKNYKNICNGKPCEDTPVQLLWKGGTLVESSIHCSIREELESKCQSQKPLTSSKLSMKPSDLGAGDELDENVSQCSSDESTMRKMAEIRKLLESEPEIIQRFVDKCAGTDDFPEEMITELRQRLASEITIEKDLESSTSRDKVLANTRAVTPNEPGTPWKLNLVQNKLIPDAQKLYADTQKATFSLDREERKFEYLFKPDGPTNYNNNVSKESAVTFENSSLVADETGKNILETGEKEGAKDVTPDPKLMNRIRLLESRLRLEELKNRNWINRMSRAEGILQQLNKQVERIEETRPVETLTETLKITSTVTNWMPSIQPRRNQQFTLVNQYPSYFLQLPFTSLTDVIKREIGLPSSGDYNRHTVVPLPPPPPLPALLPPTTTTTPQPSFLSKFLSK